MKVFLTACLLFATVFTEVRQGSAAEGVPIYFSNEREQKANDPQLFKLAHDTMGYEGHQDWRLTA